MNMNSSSLFIHSISSLVRLHLFQQSSLRGCSTKSSFPTSCYFHSHLASSNPYSDQSLFASSFSSSAPSSTPSSSNSKVFDRSCKRVQLDVAGNSPEKYDSVSYIYHEIADRLVSRLDDIGAEREFPRIADIGSKGGVIVNALSKLNRKRKLQGILQTDFSSKLLELSREKEKKYRESLLSRHSPIDGKDFSFQYTVTDEDFLPLKSGSYDVVFANLSFHFCNDLQGIFQKIYDSLIPDGLFLSSHFADQTLHELRTSFLLADLERRNGITPHTSPYINGRSLGDLLSSAKFNLPTVDTDQIVVRYPDMFTLIDHLQSMGEQNALANRIIHGTSKDIFLAAAAIYDSLYKDEDGLIPATFDIVYGIGWKPHPSQQRAKRRGTATKRISHEELLKFQTPTTEHKESHQPSQDPNKDKKQ